MDFASHLILNLLLASHAVASGEIWWVKYWNHLVLLALVYSIWQVEEKDLALGQNARKKETINSVE